MFASIWSGRISCPELTLLSTTVPASGLRRMKISSGESAVAPYAAILETARECSASACTCASSAASTSFCAAAPCASNSRRRVRLRSASFKSPSAFRASACACPKSGDSTSASAPFFSTACPMSAMIFRTRPANGVKTRTVTSSFQMSRPDSWLLMGARNSTGASSSDVNCGESAGNEIFSPATLGWPAWSGFASWWQPMSKAAGTIQQTVWNIFIGGISGKSRFLGRFCRRYF